MLGMTLLDERDLTDCEKRLWRAARTGELVDLRTGSTEDDSPSSGAGWGPERTVRSDVLYQLLVSEPPPRAVVLRGARISDAVNLEAATLVCPLILEGCFFDGPINLREARAEVIRLTGCRLACVDAAQLETRGNLALARSTATVMSLMGAHLGGQLGLNGASLTGGHWPLDLAGASLSPFDDVSTNEVRLDGVALVADGLRVDGGMVCQNGFVASAR